MNQTIPIVVQGAGQERFAEALRVLERAVESRAFPGCCCGVLAGGAVVLEAGFGWFEFNCTSRAVELGTRWDIASITKVAATTAMAMLLVQRGRLDLEAPVGQLLPEFLAGRIGADRAMAERVLVRHLLAHSTGLPGYARLFAESRTAEETRRKCLLLALEAEPGVRAEYSDPGFMILGWLLEAVAGERLEAFVRREVLEPLGMRSTGFYPARSERVGIAPSEWDAELRLRRIQGEVQDENAWMLGGVAGHAGLFSTVGDLLLLAGELIQAAKDTSGRLFKAETVARFAERQPPAGSTRALGWDTPAEEGSSAGGGFSGHTIGHLGFSGCSLWIDLEAEAGMVLLTNRTWPDRANQAIRAVRPAFHDAVWRGLRAG